MPRDRLDRKVSLELKVPPGPRGLQVLRVQMDRLALPVQLDQLVPLVPLAQPDQLGPLAQLG